MANSSSEYISILFVNKFLQIFVMHIVLSGMSGVAIIGFGFVFDRMMPIIPIFVVFKKLK